MSQEVKTFLVVRDLPVVGNKSRQEMVDISRNSYEKVKQIDGMAWVHIYVTADQSFCVYRAYTEEDIKKHAELAGLPVGKISEVVGDLGTDVLQGL